MASFAIENAYYLLFSQINKCCSYIHTFGILFAAGVSVLETMKVSASLIGI